MKLSPVLGLVWSGVCGCAGAPVVPADEQELSTSEQTALCVEIAHLAFGCPAEFVDARLAADGRDQVPRDVREELLRQLRDRRNRGERDLAARCAADAAQAPPARFATLRRVDACSQRAACTLKIECLRPVLSSQRVTAP